MFGKHFAKALRALHPTHLHTTPRPGLNQSAHQPRASASLVVSAIGPAAAGAGALQGLAKGLGAGLAGSAVLLGGVAVFALSASPAREAQADAPLDAIPWVQDIIEGNGVMEVLSPGQMLRQHPVGKLVTDQDHLFDVMIENQQIKEFRCFYDQKQQRFHSIVQLGRDVCGFPQTVHGGLTAAIMDETLGGLSVSVWREGKLGFRPPAYTARLEVDYKKKIPAGSLVLCSTEVEVIDDRKVWMTATLSNGNGTVYASGRALFVAPRLRNILTSWLPGQKRE